MTQIKDSNTASSIHFSLPTPPEYPPRIATSPLPRCPNTIFYVTYSVQHIVLQSYQCPIGQSMCIKINKKITKISNKDIFLNSKSLTIATAEVQVRIVF